MSEKQSHLINILFLGASKRVTLLERFIKASQEEKLQLKIFSCEASQDFYPISKYAKILVGPSFKSDAFLSWLSDTVQEYKIDIIIPNMDAATVALSKFSSQSKVFCAVSDYDLCLSCEDKLLTRKLFTENNLPFIPNTPNSFPKIAKNKNGFGGKGIYTFNTQIELDNFFAHHDVNQFIVEDFISGAETTTDLFIDKNKRLLGYVLRDRLEVSDGEVMVCKTRSASSEEEVLFKKLADMPGWYGCITVQTIRDKQTKQLYLMEINPRFGGGCTAAIEAGLNMPLYIIKDFLNASYPVPQKLKHLHMTRARQDFFSELNDNEIQSNCN